MPQASYLSGGTALRVFLSFAGAYFLSYAFRSVNAVIAPALQAELKLSNSDLGLLSSAYFVSFAAMQLPLGIWLDRYGARRTECSLLLFAAAGAAVFALSDSLAGLWIGRAMIGLGVSACLMAPFKGYRQWFAPQRQSQLASRMLVAGTCGALASTVPVAMALPYVGWRGVFLIMAALILLSAAAIFFVVGKVERSQREAAKGAPAAASGAGYRRIFSEPYFRRLALIGTVNQGTFVALQTLWAGPWMVTVLGMNKDEASQALFVFNLCLMLSYLGLSWWAPRHVSQDGGRGLPVLRVVAVGLIGCILSQLAILLSTMQWSWMLWILLGLCATVMTLAQTQITLSFPPALAGRANTAYNLMIFLGAFAMQWGIGIMIDAIKAAGVPDAAAMRAAFGICLLLQAASLTVFLLNRATAPNPAPA